MRVATDFTPAIQQRAGVARYAEELTRALVAQGSHDIRLFYTDPAARMPALRLDVLTRKTLRWANKARRPQAPLSHRAGLPKDALVGDADVFDATDQLLPPLGDVRSVFTLHGLVKQRAKEVS